MGSNIDEMVIFVPIIPDNKTSLETCLSSSTHSKRAEPVNSWFRWATKLCLVSSLPQYFLCMTDLVKLYNALSRRLELKNNMWGSVKGRRRCATLFQSRSNSIWIITFWMIFTWSYIFSKCTKGGHFAESPRRGRTLCAWDGGGYGEGGGAGAQCGPEGVFNRLPGVLDWA